MNRSLLGVAIVVLVSISISAQTQLNSPGLADILNSAETEAAKYTTIFRDLMAEEVKVFEEYGRNSEYTTKRTVRSNFIVYTLQNAGDRSAEFRNVVEVDGKPVPDQDKRASEFFERVSKAASSENELERINEETQRFDYELNIAGLTLFPGIPLSSELRNFIDFKLAGRGELHGSDTHRIEYKQTKPSPLIQAAGATKNPASKLAIELGFKVEPAGTERIRGSFFIDPLTYQIRKEVREVTVQPKDFPAEVVVSQAEFNYADSGFGTLTPSKIVYTHYRFDKKAKRSVPDIRVTFTYTKFSKADVEFRSAEIK